jgi:hypothetical protein
MEEKNSSSSNSDSIDFGGYEYDPSVDMSGYIPLSERMKSVSSFESVVESGKQGILFPAVESLYSASLQDARNEVMFYDFNVERLVGHYQAWLKVHYNVVLCGWNQAKGDYDYIYFRSAKRGDKRYALRVERRFEKMNERFKDVSFFGYGVRGNITTQCLSITLTYARSLSVRDAWGSLGRDLNRFLAGLRKHYGHREGKRWINAKIEVIRVWEAQEDCYPHTHLMILFHDHVFDGFSHVNDKGKLSYRIKEREIVESYWNHGFVDTVAMSSVKSGFRYLKKYLTKSVRFKGFRSDKAEYSKAVKTLACCWVFRKMSFSVGHRRRSDDGEESECSPADLISDCSNSNRSVEFISCLDGSKLSCAVSEWYLYGYYKGDNVLLPFEFGHLSSVQVHSIAGDVNFKAYERRMSFGSARIR